MKRDTNLIVGILGVALAVGFFLPWIDGGGHFTLSGWFFVKSSYVAWHTRLALGLLPLAGAAMAVAGFTNSPTAPALGSITGLGVLGYMFFRLAWGFVKTTGFGLWIVLAAAVVAIIVGATRRKPAA
jgi:hypothetical protein